jgi:starch synthase (maltosyl-transferring)
MPPAHLAGPAQPPGPHPAFPHGIAPIGRIPVTDDLARRSTAARRAAKSVVDEQFWIQARVFREGHDAVNATAVLTDPDGVR